MLGYLVQLEENFVFKGGTSLLLHVSKIKRLSIYTQLNKRKKELVSLQNIDVNTNISTVSINSHSDEKIKLFRSLLRGKEAGKENIC